MGVLGSFNWSDVASQMQTWGALISSVGGALVTMIPFIIALVKAIHAKRRAKDKLTKDAANADLLNCVQGLIVSAEAAFKSVDTILKQQGQSAGATKKETVLSKLRAYALDKNYTFDESVWSSKIDEIVKLTKQVNIK